MTDTVGFSWMKDGTREDDQMPEQLEKPFLQPAAHRVLEALRRKEYITLEGCKGHPQVQACCGPRGAGVLPDGC